MRAIKHCQYAKGNTGQRCHRLLAHKNAQRVFGSGLRLRSGCPLQQVLAADPHAPQRSGNGIDQQYSFMKQLGKLPRRCTK